MTRTFKIAVVGAFSGKMSREEWLEGAGGNVLRPIDVDDFDAELARLAPTLELGLPHCRTLDLATREGFHPDSLIARLSDLSALNEARGAVDDPERLRACLARAGAHLDEAAVRRASAPSEPALDSDAPPVRAESDADLLDAMLGGGGGVDAASDEVGRPG